MNANTLRSLAIPFLVMACGTDPAEDKNRRQCLDCSTADVSQDIDPSPQTENAALIRLAPLEVSFDRLTVTALQKGETEQTFTFQFLPEDDAIEFLVEPGNYQISLDYFVGEAISYSSSYCNAELRKSENQRLKVGLNNIQINVCDLASTQAQVVIEPILHETGE